MTVISMVERKKENRSQEDRTALKWLAIQLAAQLPKDEAEALEVLDLTKTLVRSFLAESKPA